MGDRPCRAHPGSDYALTIAADDLVASLQCGDRSGSPMGGIVAHGFMEDADIDTLSFDLSGRSRVDWTIAASPRDAAGG